MCGIWGLLSSKKISDLSKYLNNFNNIQGRGPDTYTFNQIEDNDIVGFHRLKIVDITENANQPFIYETKDRIIQVVCNGEIYNHELLRSKYNWNTQSQGDCEVILHLFKQGGIDFVVNNLKGVFAGLIYDFDLLNNKINLYAFRDRIGVRPLYFGLTQSSISFCSEMKGLINIADEINVFPPGCYSKTTLQNNKLNDIQIKSYYKYEYKQIKYNGIDNIYSIIRNSLMDSVKMRLMSERPICSLLSGGLDSSLISALVAKLSDQPLQTFSIGMKGGTDLKYAKMVSEHIGSIHQEIIINKKDALESIKNVLWATETFDITTIRASVGQYLICKWISENTDFKVVYIGDGSDELTGGYKYFCNAPNEIEFNDECIRLLKEIHLFDVLRADRAVSCHGLETRVPFLDSDFIDTYLSIETKYRMPKNNIEKYLLRKSFEGTNLIPDEVLWREKEAFSDGISSQEDSWFKSIQQWIDTEISDSEFEENKDIYTHCSPKTKEAYYYRKIFEEMYGTSNVIPHFWMPKWCDDTTDPSARTLKNYNSNKVEK
jgi:asparagine synthase (glutamine-hydrolysing)